MDNEKKVLEALENLLNVLRSTTTPDEQAYIDFVEEFSAADHIESDKRAKEHCPSVILALMVAVEHNAPKDFLAWLMAKTINIIYNAGYEASHGE